MLGEHWKYVLLAVCLATGLLYIYMYPLTRMDVHPGPEGTPLLFHMSEGQTMSLIERQKQIQNTRIQRIRDHCAKSETYSNAGQASIAYSSVYNFGVCMVPKCGSTFWSQTLSILESDANKAKQMFSKDRFRVHAGHKDFTRIKRGNSSGVPYVFVSRKPFSRLFSAYIDKIYLPIKFTSRYQMEKKSDWKQRRNGCPPDISFQDFLDFIISQNSAGKRLNGHWAPIYSICRPCNGNLIALLKQESFSSDAEYVLETFDVETEVKKTIMKALKSKRIDYTIPGLVNTVFHYVSVQKVFKCIGPRDVAARIWSSFQIQGYINETIPLPGELNETQLKNKTFLNNLIIDTIHANPLSVKARDTQRKTFLVNAYLAVREKTISKIKHIYREDFDVFGYDPETFA